MLTAGLISFGLVVTGQSVRARSLFDSGPPTGLTAVSGSTPNGTPQVVSLNGQPTHCATYRAPQRTVESVFRHYSALAKAQTAPDTPYLEAQQPGGATVVWVDESGQRRGAIINEDVRGGVRYQLLWAPEPEDAAPGTLHMPLGLAPPVGCDVVQSALHDGGGTCLLAALGDPLTVAGRFATTLRSAGFSIDSELPESAQRVAFTFRSPSHAGLLVAARDGGDRVRVSISVQPSIAH